MPLFNALVQGELSCGVAGKKRGGQVKMVSVFEEADSRQLRRRNSVVSEAQSLDARWQPVQPTRYVLRTCMKHTRVGQLTSKNVCILISFRVELPACVPWP